MSLYIAVLHLALRVRCCCVYLGLSLNARCSSRLLLGPVAVLPIAVVAASPFLPVPAISLRVFVEAVAVAGLVSLLLLSGLYAGFLCVPQEG